MAVLAPVQVLVVVTVSRTYRHELLLDSVFCCDEESLIQMAPALKNILSGVRLDAYWLPQPEHTFLWPCSYSDQTFGP